MTINLFDIIKHIEAHCVASGGKVIQRPGQASYCIKQ